MNNLQVVTNVPNVKCIEIPPGLWIHIMGGTESVMDKVKEILETEKGA